MDTLRSTVERAIGGQYEVLHLIGRGGMGAVYLARERLLERLVAVKVLPHDAAADPGSRERFLREAQTAARLNHPSIVPLHSFVQAEDTLLYMMGYIDGESLESKLVREGRVSATQTSRILAEIAEALHYAHTMGVIHRDVKPDNILLDKTTGKAYLTDFGIAKHGAGHGLTKTGMVVGTPHYMSPEQASAERDIDGRSDLYSLGVIGYRMVSGRLPFEAHGIQELLMQHLSREPGPLEADQLPPALAEAIMRCLKKDPSQRWPDSAAFAEAIRDRDPNDLNLPDELGGLPSALPITLTAFYVIDVLCGLLYTYSREPFFARFGIIAPLIVTGLLSTSFVVHGKKFGLHWREVLRCAAWAPPFWAGWWPNGFRRPGDLWNRFPRDLRRVRVASSAVMATAAAVVWPAIALIIILTLKGRMGEVRVLSDIIVAVGVLSVSAFGFVVWTTNKWRKQFGISDAIAVRLLSERSWDNAKFWKRPEIARLLMREGENEGDVPAGSTTPAELLASIERVGAALPEALRIAGQEAIHAGQELFRFIQAVDREILQVARDADPAERARLEQKLVSLKAVTSSGAAPHSRMRDLVEEQIAIFDAFDLRRRQLLDDRDRGVTLLGSLHLQLARSRAQFAEDALSAPELSARLRALCEDLENHRVALRDVDAMLALPVTVTDAPSSRTSS